MIRKRPCRVTGHTSSLPSQGLISVSSSHASGRMPGAAFLVKKSLKEEYDRASHSRKSSPFLFTNPGISSREALVSRNRPPILEITGRARSRAAVRPALQP